MPQLANFAFRLVKEIFAAHGIYVLEQFPDGQVMWGNEAQKSPYTGLFHMADFFFADRYDIFTIKAIVSSLAKEAELSAIEKELYDRIHEE